MVVTPRHSATARIDSPARPSVSATAMAAATMASTLSPGLGPGPVRGPGVRHSRAMDRAGSPWPAKTGTWQLLMAYTIDWFTVYRIAQRSTRRQQVGGGVPEARLHDGSPIEVQVQGEGPARLLPVNPRPVEGPQADEMRRWGNDPALGRLLVDGLADAFRVVAFDYEGQVLATPKPDPLVPDNLARDFLAVADSAGAERFAWYGYSWLAVGGLQLAIRTDRVAALVMGGFPPIDRPHAAYLRVTPAAHRMAPPPRA